MACTWFDVSTRFRRRPADLGRMAHFTLLGATLVKESASLRCAIGDSIAPLPVVVSKNHRRSVAAQVTVVMFRLSLVTRHERQQRNTLPVCIPPMLGRG